MALFPEPREDLLGEATAMPERGQLRVAGEPEEVFVGFRRDGAASLYLGEDPVLHFDRSGQLRRIFVGGQQIIARHGQLVSYARSAPGGRVTSNATPLSDHAQTQLIALLTPRLQRVLCAVADGSARWAGTTVPAEQLALRLAALAQAIGDGIRIARRPHAQ